MSSDFPHDKHDDPQKSLGTPLPDIIADDIAPKIHDTVSAITQETEIPASTFSRDAYLYAFLQNITAGSPYHRDPEKIHLPRQSSGKLSKDEERLFADLDQDDTVGKNGEIEQKKPFIPLVTPYFQETKPQKKGFFGHLKSSIKQAAKVSGEVIQKYWKGTAALGTAIALGVSGESDSKSKNEPQGAHILVPTKNTISTITENENMVTPPPDHTVIDTPSGSILDEAPTITPLEQAFLDDKKISTEHTTLSEIVLGKKIQAPLEVPTSVEVPADIPEITQEIKTSPEDDSTIPMYVISDGDKTVYITDRNADKALSVDEQRLAYFDAVGGNYSKNTKKMYDMADKMGLATGNITQKNLKKTIEFSDISLNKPITKRLTVHGLTYTISANTDIALKLGTDRLMEPLGEETDVVNIIKTPSHTDEATIPRAIIVPESENEIPRALPIFEESNNAQMEEDGVLPPKSSGSTLLMFSHSETNITQRAMSYQNTREYVLGNGKYEGSSHMILPKDVETARSVIESWLGTIDAIREVSTDHAQQKMTLQDFYNRHITIVDANGKRIPLLLATFLRKYADYTDLQITQAMGKIIPPNVIDNNPHDGKIPELIGTWDANGWSEAKDIIEQGAKRLYGEYPTTEQYNEYFRNNVSLDKHPEIKTWFEFLIHVQRESQEK